MTTVQSFYNNISSRYEDAASDSGVAYIYPELNKAIRLVADRLFWRGSKLVAEDLSLSVTASATYTALPTDYGGLYENPYTLTYIEPIRPISSQQEKIEYLNMSAGRPEKFEIKAQRLYLYPVNSSALTILGDYYKRPAALTAVTDSVPWNGMFDAAIEEFVIEAAKITPVPESELQSMIIAAVDDIVPYMDKTAPASLSPSIDWSFLG